MREIDLTHVDNLDRIKRKDRATVIAMSITGSQPLSTLQLMVTRGFNEFLIHARKIHGGDGLRWEDYHAIFGAIKSFAARQEAALKAQPAAGRN